MVERKWDSLPVFRRERQARLLKELLNDYFKLMASVRQTDAGWWEVVLPPIDGHEMRLLVEAFYVGWGRGYEQGRIDVTVGAEEG